LIVVLFQIISFFFIPRNVTLEKEISILFYNNYFPTKYAILRNINDRHPEKGGGRLCCREYFFPEAAEIIVMMITVLTETMEE
jgi:hypothetical protein